MARSGSGAGIAIAGGGTLFVLLAVACLGMAVLGRAVASSAPEDEAQPVADIPGEFLTACRAAAARFRLEPDGWSYLAGIGKIESDHGRSAAPGVRSGQNAHGCCAGPMQIDNGSGTGGGTWGAFKADGDDDGRFDIYSPADAVATAARYLAASGAPDDWPRALFAYNHASGYVDAVTAQAAAYRRAATSTPPGPRTPIANRRAWLEPVPGFPGELCDARIVAEVAGITRAYGLRLTDCYGGAPHAVGGEHPLGLATDLVPIDGDWRRTERLARAAAWRPTCASSGCAHRGPFRVVLYNGFPGHGDPRYSSRPHLHLSWDHAPARPFSPAAWVRPVLMPSSSGAR
jgi:hypothetical protein